MGLHPEIWGQNPFLWGWKIVFFGNTASQRNCKPLIFLLDLEWNIQLLKLNFQKVVITELPGVKVFSKQWILVFVFPVMHDIPDPKVTDPKYLCEVYFFVKAEIPKLLMLTNWLTTCRVLPGIAWRILLIADQSESQSIRLMNEDTSVN